MSEKKLRPRDYNKLVTTLISEASKTGFEVRILDTLVYGQTGYPFLMIKSESRTAKHNCVIAAGSHGDEPQGVECLIQALGDLDKTFWNFWIFPTTNPFGWRNHSRVNGNKSGINWRVGERETPELSLIFKNIPNKVSLFLDLHGDTAKTTVYAYERHVPGVQSLARLALKDVSAYFEIEPSRTVYREPCRGGVVTSGKEGTLEEWMFEQRGVIYSITLEIPGRVLGTGVNRIAGGARLIVSTLNNFELAKGDGTKVKQEIPQPIVQPNKEEVKDVGRDG